MSPNIQSLIDIYSFNTAMVRASLADLSPEDAGRRFRGGEGSSVVFLLGHVLSTRHGLLRRFGAVYENPWAELFGGQQGARDASEYPPFGELVGAWDETAEVFQHALENLAEDQLLAAASGFPVADQTARGAIMFLAWHESYHVGQIGLMRTEMGYPSMQARLYEARGKG